MIVNNIFFYSTFSMSYVQKESLVKSVIVLGGYGNFGKRIVE
ncbi:MAG: hypothetical protein ACI9ES_001326, partial [Oceanospirillaceae bacterium]